MIAGGTVFSFNLFFIYYSMLGFQVLVIWHGQQQMREQEGFDCATAGRTTLAGEGLQHNDGHSHAVQ